MRKYLRNDDKITVCAECLQASCWQGEFMCDEARYADITEKTVGELREISMEHPDYWKADLRMKNITE